MGVDSTLPQTSASTGRFTHFRPALALTIFRGRPSRAQLALCGAWLRYPAEWSAEPTCPTCRAEMARIDQDDADAAF